MQISHFPLAIAAVLVAACATQSESTASPAGTTGTDANVQDAAAQFTPHPYPEDRGDDAAAQPAVGGSADAGGSSDAAIEVASGPVWQADGRPNCEGILSLPTAGSHTYQGGTRYKLRRTNPSDPWTQMYAQSISAIRVDSSGTIDLSMTLPTTYESPGAGGSWVCRSGDCPFTSSTMLNASGEATTTCTDYRDCQPPGGSSTGGHTSRSRTVLVHAGANCTTITDASPFVEAYVGQVILVTVQTY